MKTHQPIEFPKDHSSHESIIEWWYFNGQLKGEDGKDYSFMDCLFKADLKKVGISFFKKLPIPKSLKSASYVYFAHSVVSDIETQKNYKDVQYVSLPSRDSFSRPQAYINYVNPIITKGYVNCEISQTSQNDFHIKTEYLDLQLTCKKNPLLEGGDGYISVCGRESYYYSLTDLEAVGQICIDGKWINVNGKVWMDHQWADVSYTKDKWTWFSIQLDDGTDMMLVEYADAKNKEYLADIIYKSGEQEHLKSFELTPSKETWKSATTKAEYPMGWSFKIPEKEINLEVKSIMSDQEMIFGDINYWEGPLKVSGTIKDRKVNGIGFMELVGYPSKYNYLTLFKKQLSKTFWKSKN